MANGKTHSFAALIKTQNDLYYHFRRAWNLIHAGLCPNPSKGVGVIGSSIQREALGCDLLTTPESLGFEFCSEAVYFVFSLA